MRAKRLGGLKKRHVISVSIILSLIWMWAEYSRVPMTTPDGSHESPRGAANSIIVPTQRKKIEASGKIAESPLDQHIAVLDRVETKFHSARAPEGPSPPR